MKAALFLIVGVAAGQSCLTTDWADWGECSLTCGGGQRTRTRKIAVHPADGNLTSCGDLAEEGVCDTQPCPEDMDCLYSLWSDWTPCTKECLGDDGVAGNQGRSRSALRQATGAGAACDSSTLSETRTCGDFPCAPTNCTLGAWDNWGECSASCSGGTQTRTKKLIKAAAHGGTCNYQLLGAQEDRPCNTGPCPQEPTFDASITNSTSLAGDIKDRVLAVDATHVFTGGAKLYKLNSNTLVAEGNWAGPTTDEPLQDVSAISEDGDYVHIGAQTSVGHHLFKIFKTDLTLHQTTQVTAEVKAVVSRPGMSVKGGSAIASLASTGMGMLVDTSTNPPTKHAIAGQGNDMHIDGAHLWVSCWGGKLLKLNVGDLSHTVDSREFNTDYHLVSMQVDDTYVYLGTDTTPGRVLRVAKNNLDAAPVVLELGNDEGACVSMTMDQMYLYCGTTESTGQVLKISKANLGSGNAAVVDTGYSATTGRVYAIDHDASDGLWVATYSATSATTVANFHVYLNPQDCQYSDWSSWLPGCVNYWSRTPVNCGSGVRIREREVLKEGAWGGVPCNAGLLVSTEDCQADQPECCYGGKVWSDERFAWNCKDRNLTTHTEDAQNQPLPKKCRCPRERPIPVGGACLEPEKCEAHKCEHTTCKFMGNSVRVVHKGKSGRDAVDHHCTYTPGRMGDCSCTCWQRTCAQDSDCNADPTVATKKCVNPGPGGKCQWNDAWNKNSVMDNRTYAGNGYDDSDQDKNDETQSGSYPD